jgi:hypothetical protein
VRKRGEESGERKRIIRYYSLLKAGIAISPLTDLISYTTTAHPFSRHYHHSLLGPLPEKRDLYIQRYFSLSLSLSLFTHSSLMFFFKGIDSVFFCSSCF